MSTVSTPPSQGSVLPATPLQKTKKKKKWGQQQQLRRLELHCSSRLVRHVLHTTSARHLNPGSPLNSLPNTGLIKTLISATQNSTLHLYCEFDAQCLWCKDLLASVISVRANSEEQCLFEKESRQMSRTPVHKEGAWEEALSAPEIDFNLRKVAAKKQRDIFDSDLARYEKK